MHYARRTDSSDSDGDDHVLEVAIHLSKKNEQPTLSDEPKYVYHHHFYSKLSALLLSFILIGMLLTWHTAELEANVIYV